MELKKISYAGLNGKQKEVFNFQKVAGRLADYGFNCIKLADDWKGADFLAYHVDGENTLKVQLKSRVAINRKYEGKGLYLAFPVKKGKGEDWYLVDHDELVTLVKRHSTWAASDSWKKQGAYSSNSPNSELVLALEPFKLRED